MKIPLSSFFLTESVILHVHGESTQTGPGNFVKFLCKTKIKKYIYILKPLCAMIYELTCIKETRSGGHYDIIVYFMSYLNVTLSCIPGKKMRNKSTNTAFMILKHKIQKHCVYSYFTVIRKIPK